MALRMQVGMVLAGAAMLTGCEAREMGVTFADSQAKLVDNSWVTATQTCWLGIPSQHYTVASMKRYLADPIHFRAAFSTYAALDDNELRALVAKPVKDAPPPDTTMLAHSSMPVFTRAQALSGTNARDAVASNTDGATPPDAFCAAQPGTPVGFK